MTQHNDCNCAAPSSRLETILVQELVRVDAIEASDAFEVFLALNGSAIASRIGKLVWPPDFNHPCLSKNPPRWCWAASDGWVDLVSRQILIESLIGAELLDRHDAFHTQARAVDLATVVVRRAIRTERLSIEQGYAMLDFVASVGSPCGKIVEGSPLAAFCRKYPTAKICMLASAPLHPILRDGLAWLAFVQQSVHHALMGIETGNAVLAATLDEAARDAALTVRLDDASVILRGAGVDSKLLTENHRAVVGMYGPGGFWGKICALRPIPEICKYIRGGFGGPLIDILSQKTALDLETLAPALDHRLGGVGWE